MEIRLNAPILNPIHPQLKHQIRTLNLHMQLKVQVIKLDAFGRREPGEERFRHGVEVGSQGADVGETLAVSIRRLVEVRADEVVFDDEGLPRSEVPRVVETYGRFRGDWGALGLLV